ncbi:MAG: xanthine dehydrogenase family protein molybdopterin-binding subunit [Planctomycetes bacterium]|nr:xanthine dehydrogenase family protein molybdopterin-binding subunit [Planctomycetota bacterium]
MKTTRRGFLRGLLGGGALVLGAPLLGPVELFAQEGPAAEAWRASLWLAIAPDGAVTIVAHRSEMGTGIRTCLPAVLADELEADLGQVVIEQAPGDARYGSQNTDGSCSIVNFYETMREVGATARHMLEQAAAQTWGVPVGECRAREHAVHHAASERSLGFGALVAVAATLQAPDKGALRLKPRSEWRYVGKGFPTQDAATIARGEATFGADVRLTGMKFVTVARAPVLGAPLVRYDATATLEVPGVERVVELPGFKPPHLFQALGGVAVVASSTWAAIQGRRKLKVTWGESPNDGYDSQAFREQLLEAVRAPGQVLREAGDVAEGRAAAAKTFAAEYTTPLLAHAPMEPPCALAHVTEAGCEAWAPTQNPQAAQDTVAAALGLPKEQVTVHVTLLGGGFGRKSKPDYVAEAALVSRAIGAPAQVVWTREDDLRHDYYHAPAAMRFEGGLDEGGRLVSWQQRSAFSPITSTFAAGSTQPAPFEHMLGATDLPYAVPNLRIESCPAPAHVRIGWLRSVCNIWHVFGASSFLDEAAHAAGADPAEFLLQSLGEPRELELGAGVNYPNYNKPLADYPIDLGRLRGVVERVKARAWGRELPAGHGLGIAAHRSFHAYVAAVVEAAVDDRGRVRVPRVDLVVDLGLVINPDRVRAQMEGSIVFGLSLALHGEISVEQGRVVQSNFHDYAVQRIHEAPEIHVELVESDALPGGAGEPGVPPIAPALANAIFAACGQRLRDLPLQPEPRRG